MSKPDEPGPRRSNPRRSNATPAKPAGPKRGGTRRRSPTAAEIATDLERDRTAWTLVMGGASYDDAAAELGYADRSGAWRAVDRYTRRIDAETIDSMRDVEGARYSRLLRSQWGKAMGGDAKAAQVCLNIIRARCRLYGLDAPIRVESVGSEIDAEIRALAAQLGVAAGDEPVPDG